ncbi:hypothetical protein [Rubinisphaera brasiliensis]|uniref:Signal peptide-domain containing protein n=1 Tax=Rubinisphaera brasiliensis (strain ATCC 49424 / DSM 5305 / JCM 21570 / IAM 15109 / NBRC 103401 / IFAM 1448) TaxID=756272 RepID=F0SMG7_RUBBR|nr:hypothetical protein [Rubinisphaera brasiliensis]ADY57729.1 hypothetical protein Plabr_0099 [Rubinisphaera brasiliensis DSM 5305]
MKSTFSALAIASAILFGFAAQSEAGCHSGYGNYYGGHTSVYRYEAPRYQYRTVEHYRPVHVEREYHYDYGYDRHCDYPKYDRHYDAYRVRTVHYGH